MIRISETNYAGTPGLKIIGIYIAINIKNIVQPPRSTMEAL
jgi:hypothetical protein